MKERANYKKKYPFDENYFSNIDSHEKAYFLGWIMADGCVYKGKKGDHLIRLNSNVADIEIVKKFLNSLGRDQPIKIYGSKQQYFEVKIFSRIMFHDLCKLGCVPRKTYTLSFPEIQEDFFSSFLLGFFDGDGSVHYSKIKRFDKEYISAACDFYSTKNFCNSIREILSKAGLPEGCLYEKKGCWLLRYSGFSACEKIRHFLYKDLDCILTRKRDKFEEIFSLRKRQDFGDFFN